MEHDVRPIGVVERRGRRGEFLLGNAPARIPDGPDVARELTSLVPHQRGAAVERHVPVVPIVLHLLERQFLGRVVRSPTDGERHAMGDARGRQDRGDVRGARAPVVSDDGEGAQRHRIREVEDVLTERDELPVALSLRGNKPGRAEAAQVRNDRSQTRGVQRWEDAVPGPRVVGPSMQQDCGRTGLGAGDVAGDRQRRRPEVLQLRLPHLRAPTVSGRDDSSFSEPDAARTRSSRWSPDRLPRPRAVKGTVARRRLRG